MSRAGLLAVAALVALPLAVVAAARALDAGAIGAIAAILLVAYAPGLALTALLGGRGALTVDGAFLLRGIVAGVAAVTVALAATMLVHGSLHVTVALLVACTLLAGLVAVRRGATPAVAWPGVAGIAGLALAAVAAVVAARGWRYSPLGDDTFHLGRVRMLAADGELRRLGLHELIGGSDHPGYAIPGWHAIAAGGALVSGVDAAVAMHALAVAAAAAAVLAAWVLGGTIHRDARIPAASLGLLFGFWVTSRWSGLDLPISASAQVLFPAGIALIALELRRRSAAGIAMIALVATALAGTHVTYIVPLGIVAVGIAVATALAGQPLRTAATTLVAVLLALALPLALAALWALDLALDVRHAATRQTAREVGTRFTTIVEIGPFLVASPSAVATVLLGLACAPLAWRTARLRADAVLGAGSALLVAAFLPPVFTVVVVLLSASQAQRLLTLVPVAALAAAAVVGTAALRGRPLALGYGLVAVSAALGIATARDALGPGPAAVAAVLIALLAIWIGRSAIAPIDRRLLVAPVAVLALAIVLAAPARTPTTPNGAPLPAGLQRALRALPPGTGVAATPRVAYLASGAAPVRVYASMPTHVAVTPANDPYRRIPVNRRLLAPRTPGAERLALAQRLGVEYVVVLRTSSPRLFDALAAARWPTAAEGRGWRIYEVPRA